VADGCSCPVELGLSAGIGGIGEIELEATVEMLAWERSGVTVLDRPSGRRTEASGKSKSVSRSTGIWERESGDAIHLSEPNPNLSAANCLGCSTEWVTPLPQMRRRRAFYY
jgi:hypothetical protein